jgi:hypothetical protein
MTPPAAGLQTFHLGRPIELLYRIEANRADGETWRVRPLFVAGEPDRDEFIRHGAALHPIHTNIAARR